MDAPQGFNDVRPAGLVKGLVPGPWFLYMMAVEREGINLVGRGSWGS